jgi:hypothetical protein
VVLEGDARGEGGVLLVSIVQLVDQPNNEIRNLNNKHVGAGKMINAYSSSLQGAHGNGSGGVYQGHKARRCSARGASGQGMLNQLSLFVAEEGRGGVCWCVD